MVVIIQIFVVNAKNQFKITFKFKNLHRLQMQSFVPLISDTCQTELTHVSW